MAKQVLIIEGWEVPHLIKYAVSYNKVCADDTGQDMSGEKKGTLIGLFPKLNVEVGSFQADEMALFLSQANKAKLKIEWHDAENQVMRSGEYSLDDVTIDLKNVERMVYNPFSFQLTPIKKR